MGEQLQEATPTPEIERTKDETGNVKSWKFRGWAPSCRPQTSESRHHMAGSKLRVEAYGAGHRPLGRRLY
jgi:hypothetical protein